MSDGLKLSSDPEKMEKIAHKVIDLIKEEVETMVMGDDPVQNGEEMLNIMQALSVVSSRVAATYLASTATFGGGSKEELEHAALSLVELQNEMFEDSLGSELEGLVEILERELRRLRTN